MYNKFLCLLLLLFTLTLDCFGSDDSLFYSSNAVSYYRDDSLITLKGECEINYGSMQLFADTVAYYTDKKLLIATGDPLLIDKEDTLRGHYIAYNLTDRTGKVKSGVYNTPDTLHYTGKNIVRAKDSALYIQEGTYTTCTDKDHPHYYFYSDKFKIVPNNKALAKPFILTVAESPIAALPYFIVPLNKNRQSGWLTPRWGVGISGEGSVDNMGYYWAINDYVDFLAAGKIDNFEEYWAKSKGQYKVGDGLNGTLEGTYQFMDEFQTQSNSWTLNYNHSQDLLPDKSFKLEGAGALQGSNRFYSDLNPDTILNRPELTQNANLSLSKKFNSIGGYASLKWNRNHNLKSGKITQDLPSARFKLYSRPLIPQKEKDDRDETGDDEDTTEAWYNKVTWSYNFNANQKSYESTHPDSGYDPFYLRGADQTVDFNAPITVADYFTLSPHFSVSQVLFDNYADTIGDTIPQLKFLYDTLTQYEIENKEWKDKIDSKKITLDSTFTRNDTTFYLHSPQRTYDTIIKYDTTYYYDDDYSLSKAHQYEWRTGANLSTKIYGLFPINIGKLKAIRHTLTPTVGYTFVPEKDLDVRFPSIGVKTVSGTKQGQLISFGLTNLFQGKFGGQDSTSDKKVNLLNFGASTAYDFEAERKRWRDISMNASIPNNKVSLSYSGRLTPYDRDDELITPTAMNHNLTVSPRMPTINGKFWSGDMFTLEDVAYDGYLGDLHKNESKWNIGISPNYHYTLKREYPDEEFEKTESYRLGSNVRVDFSHRWNMSWSGTWSFTESQFTNQNIALNADLNCWDLKFDWYPTGVNSGRVYFVVALKKHREIKWEQR